ncbi:MAG: hydrolase [Desulfuromonadales bacterium]|nr:hydrolase [Desulfuromonadales bacterium]
MSELSRFQLDVDRAVLVVIDIQERLVPAMSEKVYERVRNSVEILAKTAGLLDLPVVTTEQYPKGIGHTVADLAEVCSRGPVVEKVSFGCCGEPSFVETIKETGRSQVIITGMETHVCVYQTVLGLLQHGFEVQLVKDAVCSRHKEDYLAGIACAEQAGAVVATTEMVLFQLLKESTHPAFKAVSAMVKERNR